MSPSGYIQSRELAHSSSDQYFTTLVDGRPYLPNLTVDATDDASIAKVAMVTIILSAYVSISKVNEDVCDKLYFEAEKGATFRILNVESIDWDEIIQAPMQQLTCVKVTGGITNALFRVSGFQQIIPSISSALSKILSSTVGTDTPSSSSIDIHKLIIFDSILIRIFGAEGMINRDIETSTYAALCNADIAHQYLGRFSNGRIEGWLEGFQPLTFIDLNDECTSLEIAKEMARLHCLFEVPEGELKDHHGMEVGLWDQLSGWMEQALGYEEFRTEGDTERVKKLELDKIGKEVKGIIESFTAPPEDEKNDKSKSGIVFCHNDLLAANIMRDPATNKIQLIDFEYGGTNYAAFDMANHFNEHAGGTSVEENGHPDYTLFPELERQQKFCLEYVKTLKRLESTKANGEKEVVIDNAQVHDEAMSLLAQVKEFILVNHLYWGLWAVNQAAEEGCEEFDYITYATNRFKEYYLRKAEWEKERA